MSSYSHVVHTTAKQVISRRGKNENVCKMSKNEICTCKACKTIIFHCQICKFVTFLLPSSPWLLKLPNTSHWPSKLWTAFFHVNLRPACETLGPWIEVQKTRCRRLTVRTDVYYISWKLNRAWKHFTKSSGPYFRIRTAKSTNHSPRSTWEINSWSHLVLHRVRLVLNICWANEIVNYLVSTDWMLILLQFFFVCLFWKRKKRFTSKGNTCKEQRQGHNAKGTLLFWIKLSMNRTKIDKWNKHFSLADWLGLSWNRSQSGSLYVNKNCYFLYLQESLQTSPL